MIIESHYADVFGNSSTNIVKTADYTHRQLIIARKDSCYIKVPPQLLTNLTTSFGIPISLNGSRRRNSHFLACLSPSV